MCIAACNGFASLMVVRFFIGEFLSSSGRPSRNVPANISFAGALESAITPGFLLLISQYYTTSEHASRVLIWSVSTAATTLAVASADDSLSFSPTCTLLSL